MADIDNLVDMGFDREKAALAMKKTGNCMLRDPYLHADVQPLTCT